ncbi:MAG: prepilin-type N-terminal cleavage/methylation domain-containing protein [Chthonomonadales bacterium]
MMKQRHKQTVQGITLVELLIASLLLAIGLMGLINAWVFSFNITTASDDLGVAYNLGRYAMEQVKMNGFAGQAEGTVTTYYDGSETPVAQASPSNRYTVTVSVVSDAVKSGTAGQPGAVPADNALRTVNITVKLSGTNTILYQTGTYLVRAGI